MADEELAPDAATRAEDVDPEQHAGDPVGIPPQVLAEMAALEGDTPQGDV